MSASLIAIISLLSTLLPELSNLFNPSGIVDKIIATLEAIIPDAVQAGPEIVQEVKNIIANVKATSGVTPAQFQALEQQEAALDAAFEAAATAAGDPAPATPSS